MGRNQLQHIAFTLKYALKYAVASYRGSLFWTYKGLPDSPDRKGTGLMGQRQKYAS
jgi:hypothetical protein